MGSPLETGISVTPEHADAAWNSANTADTISSRCREFGMLIVLLAGAPMSSADSSVSFAHRIASVLAAAGVVTQSVRLAARTTRNIPLCFLEITPLDTTKRAAGPFSWSGARARPHAVLGREI